MKVELWQEDGKPTRFVEYDTFKDDRFCGGFCGSCEHCEHCEDCDEFEDTDLIEDLEYKIELLQAELLNKEERLEENGYIINALVEKIKMQEFMLEN